MPEKMIEFDERIYDVILEKFQKDPELNLYQWDINLKSRKNMSEKFKAAMEKITNKNISLSKKNIEFKEEIKREFDSLKEHASGIGEIKKIAYDIVNVWGGINLKEPDNDDKIMNVVSNIALENEDPNKYNLPFSSISSMSKIASFFGGDKYPVYDSRVAFTLNWVIFVNGLHEKNSGKMKFFRQPNGQNSDVGVHNQETFFNLVYKDFNVKDNEEFYYNPKDTYKFYCQLLKNTCQHYEKHKSSYEEIKRNVSIGELEMSLFSIATAKEKKDAGNRFITSEMSLYFQFMRSEINFPKLNKDFLTSLSQ